MAPLKARSKTLTGPDPDAVFSITSLSILIITLAEDSFDGTIWRVLISVSISSILGLYCFEIVLTSNSKEASTPSNSYPSFSNFLSLDKISVIFSSLTPSVIFSSSSLYRILLLPAKSEIRILLEFPIFSGETCSYVRLFFTIALTWMPPLWANALLPINGALLSFDMFAISLIKFETS